MLWAAGAESKNTEVSNGGRRFLEVEKLAGGANTPRGGESVTCLSHSNNSTPALFPPHDSSCFGCTSVGAGYSGLEDSYIPCNSALR